MDINGAIGFLEVEKISMCYNQRTTDGVNQIIILLKGIEKYKQSNEMQILRAFVEEFSPIHAGQGHIKDFTYDELFDIVSEIVESHISKISSRIWEYERVSKN